VTVTAPWDAAAAKLIADAHGQTFTATFTTAAGNGIPVQVSTLEITMDHAWSPYCQGTVTGPVPESQAVLDALDPRRLVRCDVSAGYVLTDGTQDVHPVAVLYLSARDVDRPGNTLTLSLQGPEFVWDRYIPKTPGSICSNNLGYDAAANSDYAVNATLGVITVNSALADAASIPPAGFDLAGAVSVAGWGYKTVEFTTPFVAETWYKPGPGQGGLDFLREIAARVGAWFYCDELGVWRLIRPPGPGAAAAVLSVGAAGTVIDSVTEMTRDDWANDVTLRWAWTEQAKTAAGDVISVEKQTIGHAEIVSGPYTPGTAGRVTHYEDRDGPVAQAVADQVCRTILRKLTLNGRVITLSAAAAYWVRPYDTVTVQLPTGPQERHQVASVTFRLHDGSMQVTTFLPIDPASIGG